MTLSQIFEAVAFPMRVISRSTILVDLRKDVQPLEMQNEKAKEIAYRYFHSPSGDTLRSYHVASVAQGLWIVSLNPIHPEDTRPIALDYVNHSIGESKNELIAPNELDKRASEMKFPNVYDKKNRGIGGKTRVKLQKIVARNTGNGQVYGRRSIAQKY